MEPITLDLVKRALLKRVWAILGFSALVAMMSVFIAFVIPPNYVAGAKILVESQQIPTSLAQPTVTASASERLELIRQRLMTRDNLVSLIDRLGLYEGRNDMSVSDRVDAARGATSFNRISIDRRARRRGGAEVAAFVLSFRSERPDKAAQMANELVTLVLEQNLEARSQRANRTLEFFDLEVGRIKQELVAAQERLAKFKQDNSEALPTGESFRRNELAGLRARRFELETRLLDLRARLREQRQRLESGAYGPEFAKSSSPETVALAQLERDLSAASAIYAPSHPTIRRLRSQIAQLESRIGVEADAETVRADPEVLRRQARDDLMDEISLIRGQIKVGEEELVQIRERRAEIEDAIARSPTVGLELSALENNLAAIQSQYQEAVSKRTAAETGQKLEVNQQAERFEIIEQARIPDEPVSPDRLKIAALGSAAGLGLALGLALLIEMLNRTIYTSADLERMLELRPMSTIPYIRTAQDKRRRLVTWLVTGFAVVALPLAALGALHEFYMPIDLMWTKFVERSGADRIIDLIAERF